MAEDDRAKTRCYAEHFLYEPKQLRCFSYGWNKREGRCNLLLPLKNRSRFRRSPGRSGDLERDVLEPERIFAPTAVTMTAGVVFHYAVRSFFEFRVIYSLTPRMSRHDSFAAAFSC